MHHRITTTLALSVLFLTAGCAPDGVDSDIESDIVRPAKIVTVGGTGDIVRTYPGRVQAAKRVALSFRVAGPVIDIPVARGQKVSAGHVLARIDPRDYQVRVANLEAQLTAARAQQLQAAETYQRVRGLYEHDNASKADFDNAKAALDVSRAQVEATEQALKAARLSLADTSLKAPYDGTVADRLVEEHQTVAAGQPVIQFQGASGLEVVIHVPESEIAELTQRTPAGIAVRFDAVGEDRAFPATVKEFATEPDPQTRTFPVILDLAGPPPDDLLPGMTASVDWSTTAAATQRDPIVVPLAAVGSTAAGDAFVWRVRPEDMTVERVPVATGELTDDGISITDGLAPGDRIIAAGVDFVVDGQRVRPLDGAGD